MTTTRRTKIKFENHELTLISLPPGTEFVCSKCKAEIDHLAVARDVETAEGKLLISAFSENLFGEINKTEET